MQICTLCVLDMSLHFPNPNDFIDFVAHNESNKYNVVSDAVLKIHKRSGSDNWWGKIILCARAPSWFEILKQVGIYLGRQREVGSRGPLLPTHGTPDATTGTTRSTARTSPSGGGVDCGGALALPPLLRRSGRL